MAQPLRFTVSGTDLWNHLNTQYEKAQEAAKLAITDGALQEQAAQFGLDPQALRDGYNERVLMLKTMRDGINQLKDYDLTHQEIEKLFV